MSYGGFPPRIYLDGLGTALDACSMLGFWLDDG